MEREKREAKIKPKKKVKKVKNISTITRALDMPPTFQRFKELGKRFKRPIDGLKCLYRVFTLYGTLKYTKLEVDSLIKIDRDLNNNIVPLTTHIIPKDEYNNVIIQYG